MTQIKYEICHDLLPGVEWPTPKEDSLDIMGILAKSYNPLGIYELSRNKWEQQLSMVSPGEVLARLAQIGNVREVANTNSDLRWLGETRKSGTRLVDTWKILDASHKPPKKLKAVVKTLGRFKDQVWHLAPEERKAEGVLRAYSELQVTKVEFIPASFQSFIDNYVKLVLEIQALVALPTLTTEQHHDVRKKVRAIKHFYSLADLLEEDAGAKHLFSMLTPVSDEMGKEHDQFVIRGYAADQVNEPVLTQISADHLIIINRFLSLHKEYLAAAI